eukprot:TRINITY_DN7895_c0_g1_i3.p2 TRINITY_DN7895_c0_g1~~TRINITY_DN7895_c0_g1_i3.p2  ORF type:complete len:235 (-),score=81.77 TRINITY_DN7895_c0_g1_i3:330-1034(-)
MLCDAAGHLKLADFGSAVDHGAQAEEEAGRVEGTADYVAPEVAGGQHRVSFASDAWALGCVLFQLIAGHSPVTACHGEEHAATLCRVVQFSTEDHGLFPEGFAAELQPVVQQLLLADPAARLLGGWSKVKAHAVFDAVDWNAVFEQEAVPLGGGAVSASTAADQRWNRRKQSMMWAPLPAKYNVGGAGELVAVVEEEPGTAFVLSMARPAGSGEKRERGPQGLPRIPEARRTDE